MKKSEKIERVYTQPGMIQFGRNYVGARICGSFQAIPAQSCESLRSVECGPESCDAGSLPDWIEVQEPVATGQEGLAWNFSIRTETPGSLLATLSTQCDSGTARCQIEVELRDGQPALGDMVFLDSPFDCHTSESDMHPLVRILSALDFRFHYVDSLADVRTLQPRAAVIHGSGLCSTSPDDVELLLSWAESGTNIVILADEFYRGTTDAANKVLEHFDMRMLQDGRDAPGITPEERTRRLMDWQQRYMEAVSEKDHIMAHPLTAGIGCLHWFRPCPVICTGSKSQPLVLNPGDGDECFAAVSQPRGYVVAVGLSLLTSLARDGWPYDNDRFLANLFVGGDAESFRRTGLQA